MGQLLTIGSRSQSAFVTIRVARCEPLQPKDNKMETILSLIDYVNNHVECDLIDCLTLYAEPEGTTARVLCIKILGWLRDCANDREVPLGLQSFPWCKALQRAVEECRPLSQLLQSDSNEIRLRDSIAAERVYAIVLNHYRPHMFKH